MIDFFVNLWNDIVANKDAILAFLTSGAFASAVASVVTVIVQMKRLKVNTASNKELTDSLKSNTNLNEKLENIKEEYGELKTNFNKLQTDYNNLVETNTELLLKLDAMLDVQSLVYSTVKDNDIRTNVSKILTSAKYSSKDKKAKLLKEIEELKAKLAEETEKSKKMVQEKLEEVKTIVEPTNTTIKRY